MRVNIDVNTVSMDSQYLLPRGKDTYTMAQILSKENKLYPKCIFQKFNTYYVTDKASDPEIHQ